MTKLIKKERCSMEGCKKKLSAVKFTCNCGKNYCTAHRLAESHNCTYDFREEGKKILEENNPLVVKPKIIKI